MNSLKIIAITCLTGFLISCGGGDSDTSVALPHKMAATNAVIPESGVWWNPAEGGRGFSLEVQGNILSLAAYLYETDGRATWYSTGGSLNADGSFDGTMQEYTGGQSLTAPYKSAAIKGDATSVRLACSTSTSCTLTWAGGSIPIQRFLFGGTTVAANPPESGVWWNPAEGGRGYFLDVQSNIISFSAYLYDSSGNATWYSSSGTLNADGSFDGKLQEYSGGQSMKAAYKPATIKGDVSTMRLACTSSTTCTLSWAGGTVPLQRYVFGVSPVPQGSTAPSSPLIGTATFVNGNAVISFTPPSPDQSVPVTRYTAVCQSGSSKVSGWSLASPVTGLTSGLTYSCTVNATNAVGVSKDSGTVVITPSVELSKASDCLNRDLFSKNISWQTVEKYSPTTAAASTLTTNFTNEINATFAGTVTAKLTTTPTSASGTSSSSLTYRHLVGNEIVFVGKNSDVDVGYRDSRYTLQYGTDSAPGNAYSTTTTFTRQKTTGELQNWESSVRFFGKSSVGGYQTCRFDVTVRGLSGTSGSFYQTLYIGVTNGLTIKQLAYSSNAVDSIGRFNGTTTDTWEFTSASINGVPVSP
ncbi:MAG: fibronectin type III domain-containing protein [Candidatus Methylumidiphilus sp.]